ncbi:MAG: rhodanese-like domain-containing protein [Cytophagaceae bacterium]|jgi:rhodanese-related sulfurtransferase|nr:rhodanese-like domain-containing protein [Cytophagaceae bacterium]
MRITDTLKNGADIIDVRSPMEFAGGFVEGSINIPLQQLQEYLSSREKNKPVVFCCASGNRSAQATAYAQQLGIEAYNGGAWIDVYYEMKENV